MCVFCTSTKAVTGGFSGQLVFCFVLGLFKPVQQSPSEIRLENPSELVDES